MTLPSPHATRPVHPTARAFFHALDQQQDTEHSTSKRSELIQKQSQTLGWRSRHSQAERYPVVLDGLHFSVRQVQRGEVDGTYGTGATVWPASMVLLKYLERNSSLLSQKFIVDLGAGTGVTSIAAALLGAKHVVCTDGTASVVRLAQDNAQHVRNTLDCMAPMEIKEYMWGDGSLRPDTFDIILVSDCVLPKLYPIQPLVEAIDELLGDTSVALLSYEHRYYEQYDPRTKFRQLASERGLSVVVIPPEQHDPVYSVDDIELWEVRRL